MSGAELDAIIAEVARHERLDPRDLDRILRRHPKDGRGFFRKREILAAFREAPASLRHGLDEETFALRLRTCPTRSLSGVTPVTVLTKPFPCPGKCVFCPSDVRMPKSYLRDEPGCQRAEANRFDPYLQTWNRLRAYREMGHPTGKVELIVLGGTWSFHPEPYQRWFVLRCLDAMNDFGRGRDGRDDVLRFTADPRAAEPGSGRSYNVRIARRLRAHQDGSLEASWEAAGWPELAASQRENARAGARCVGLSLETRPDAIDAAEVRRLRRLGATKIQLGIQSLSDRVLLASRRGHDVATSRAAVSRLRAAGFKIHAHWMANLPAADLAGDREDFARLFDDPAIRPDELKVYPCSLLESAELMDHYRDGRWRPYGVRELVDLLADVLPRVSAWCRVTRVIRDIPSPDIVAGNRQTNLRERVEAEIAERGRTLSEIRSRELRGRAVDLDALQRRVRAYATSIGQERFVEWVDREGRIAGFLRLALPGPDAPAPAELAGAAVVRELHVYGAALDPGRRREGPAQHRGLGRALLEHAALLARERGHDRLAVISAIGTRDYYLEAGFADGELYPVRSLR